MSLNKFMHPRNRYKNSKPSFLKLALKYPEFRAHTTQDESGKVFLDFKNAEALKALTTCLLKEDFNLTVDLPSDRLVPTLPLRLNYIHWIEDIVGTDAGKWGIDIGTGASCIYPLLASTINKWQFFATEADTENVFFANKNVSDNGLKDLIHVNHVSSEDILMAPLKTFTQTDKFDFCMCNPPFFADHMEAQAITKTRSLDRPEAKSVSTASPQECIATGGEVGFIRQMIEESVLLQDKIRVYTSMVGKKSSLTQLKEEFRHQKITKFSSTEFCQGKTMRWGIAWTFDESITFPKSEFDSRKEKPPLQYIIPKGAGNVEYKVHEVASYLRNLMESIKVHCYQGKKAKSYSSMTLTAVENTWCHQRRLRRQRQKQNNDQPEQDTELKSSTESEVKDANDKATDLLNGNISEDNSNKRSLDNPEEVSNAKKLKLNNNTQEQIVTPEKVSNLNLKSSNSVVQDSCSKKIDNPGCSKETGPSPVTHEDVSPKEFILKCVMRLKRNADDQVMMELEWLDGKSRELMHQLFTFIKNKLNSSQS